MIQDASFFLNQYNVYNCQRNINILAVFPRWGGDGTPLPDGIVYEGVSDEPRKVTVKNVTLLCVL